MRIGPFYFGLRSQPQNINKDTGTRPHKQVTQKNKTREQKTIKKWRSALRRAENITNPRRDSLHEVFDEVVLDPHLSATLETRTLQVTEKNFMLVNDEGEMLDESEIIQHQWFRQFIRLAMKAKYWGFALIELGPIVEDVIQEVFEVPRNAVFPERRTFSLSGRPFDNEQSIDEEPYSPWLVLVDNGGFGLLNKATPVVLWKRIGMAAFAEYADFYGLPPIHAKAQPSDQVEYNNLEQMLKDFRETDYLITEPETEVQPMDITQTGGTGPHSDLVDKMNKEISKLILGQTMTTEDGSSYSQAQVHGRILETFERSDLQYIRDIVNNQLLPLLTQHGLISEESHFTYDLQEELDVTQKWEVTKSLIQSRQYQVPADFIEETFGVPAESVSVTTEQPSNLAFNDYPKVAQQNAQRALKFAVENKRGTNKQKRIARRIINGEGLGKRALSEISAHVRLMEVQDRPFKDSNGSLALYLHGGPQMVRWARKKLKEMKDTKNLVSQAMQEVEDYYGLSEK